jgi:urease accessory protein UreE
MSSFKIMEVTVTEEADTHDIGDLVLTHKGDFVVSWAKPKDNRAAKAVMEAMLQAAYELGQRHRGAEINEALKKLGVL